MGTHVAFLRAINVAGHTSVRMSDLKRVFADSGCEEVKTFIQSGNVMFRAPCGDTAYLFELIRNNLRAFLGSETTVVFRSFRQLQGIVRAAPFNDMDADPDIKLYVAFLSGRPRSKPKLPIFSPKDALEAVDTRGPNVFIVSRKKNGRYGFPNQFVEKIFRMQATTRNWSTVTRIADQLS